MAQIFASDTGYMRVFPVRLESEAPNALLEFIQDVGIPHHIHSDNAKEFEHVRWKQLMTDYQIKHTTTEPNSPWQNCTEGTIKEIKKQTMRRMQKTNTPQHMWDFCVTYFAEIRALSSTDFYIYKEEYLMRCSLETCQI
jgi:hypothetical protein